MARKTSQINGSYKWSIVLALVLIAFLSLASCSKQEDSTNSENENTETAEASPSPSATSPTETASPTTTASFQGTWTNKDPNTRENTKLVISQNDSEVKVHAFGKCHPSDCDWGEQAGGIIDDAAVITWDQKFVIRKMTLTLQGNNELRAVTNSIFNDSRPRRKSEQVFVRQP